MKAYTNRFRQNIKTIGRQFDFFVTYTKNNVNYILEGEKLISINPHYEANLLKSVMKEFEFESTEYIEKDTIINAKFGLQVDNSLTVKEVNEMKVQRLNQIPVNMLSSSLLGFEYINYGNYIIKDDPVYNADTQTYTYQCYDKMLYSMKDYESLGVAYPITVRDYIKALCNKLGLQFKNQNSTFANYNRQINNELYLDSEGNDLGYTYRDVLDELAQVTASIICINEETDELEIRYPKQTNDTIDEEFLKDVNVKFEEKYGPINTIVLSRSGESDNVYYPENLPENPCEIKIVDNQIMNFNDRSDYLPDIYNKLNGIEYYINDFSSTGILWYELADIYNISVENKTYKCLMLNDDVNIESGLEELIHTDMPEQSQTDYTKADKTDRKINKTYLIVDKQNQKIESVVNNVTEQNNKISQITQTVDEINSKIQDIADITTYGESNRAEVELKDINESEPIMIKVHPTSTNISYLYPRENLYPSDLQYLPNRIIRFTRTYEEDGETLTEDIDYELPDDLLRYSDTVYDEFYLDYDSSTCQVIKRCAYNADGTVRALGTEITIDYEYPTITLGEGNYTITLPGYDYGYLYARLMAKNIYTTQFYTKVETDSRINQKADEINLGVNQTLTNYSTTNQMNSAIQLKASEITSSVSETYATKTQLNTAKSEIKQTTDGITSTVSTKVGKNEIISKINQSAEAVGISANKIELSANDVLNLLAGNTINLSSKNIKISSNNFNVDKYGNMSCSNAEITDGTIEIHGGNYGSPKFQIYNDDYNWTRITPNALWIRKNNDNFTMITLQVRDDDGPSLYLGQRVNSTVLHQFYMECADYRNTSVEEIKENIEKYNKNALDIIKGIDIYSYDYKNNKCKKKKIGLIIGDNYKYSKEITDDEEKSVNLYSFISVCCKAIQEQQEEIEELKKEIEKLKGGK